MSDIDSGATLGAANEGGRKAQAKELIGQAGQTLKAEAQSFASVAQDRVRAETQRGTEKATRTLGDFANAIRKAGDELSSADQSPASRLVQQAADGLETFSRSLEGKDPGQLLNDVRDFGRRHPVAFIGGAVLAGLALGRFVRATDPKPAYGLADADLSLAEDEAFDGVSEAELGLSGGLAAPVADDLGVAAGQAPSLTTSPLMPDDGPSDLTGTPDPTAPHTGGR
ncbi:MAG: hypothetical protein DI570_19880 [Phenylobacterium zucineum]|nr:MAG: hypothetical protein DI570_19880 [Phenylobacterium zucineum]